MRSGRRRSAVRHLLLPAWSQALVLTDGHNTRFIVLASRDDRPRLHIWQLVLRPAALRLLYKLPRAKKVQKELARVQRFLFELGQAQAAPADIRR